VVSLDLKDADINTDILKWEYTQYPVGHFDLIWASPPCDTFSVLRQTWIGRKLKCHHGEVCSSELLQRDIDTIGLPILRRTEEIIDYLQPKTYFIENPQTGKMKDYMSRPFYDVDYCRYADWGYQKRTRIWTNLVGFVPKLCNKECGQLVHGKHRVNFGGGKMVMDGDKLVKVKSKEQREKYKEFENIQVNIKGGGKTRAERYRIPPALIKDLFHVATSNV